MVNSEPVACSTSTLRASLSESMYAATPLPFCASACAISSR
jgi:hypothetical protein